MCSLAYLTTKAIGGGKYLHPPTHPPTHTHTVRTSSYIDLKWITYFKTIQDYIKNTSRLRKDYSRLLQEFKTTSRLLQNYFSGLFITFFPSYGF